MREDVREIIKDTQRLCREGWEIRIRALRAVEDSKALSDEIRDNIRSSRRKLKKLKQELEKNKLFNLFFLLPVLFLSN